MMARTTPGLGNPNARDMGSEAHYTPSQRVSVDQIEALAWLVRKGDIIDAADALEALESDVDGGISLSHPDAFDFAGFQQDWYSEINDCDESDMDTTGHVEYREGVN